MKKSALSPEPINKVGILVLSEEERKANFSNIVLYIILVLPVTKTSVNKFKIITNLGIFSNLLNINIAKKIRILAKRHAFTKDHKSSIEKYFHGLLYMPRKIKTTGNNKQALIVSTLITSKKLKRI